MEAVRSLVASQLGVALLPDFAYRPWSLEQERVEARPIKEPIPAIDIGLCGAAARGSTGLPASSST